MREERAAKWNPTPNPDPKQERAAKWGTTPANPLESIVSAQAQGAKALDGAPPGEEEPDLHLHSYP